MLKKKKKRLKVVQDPQAWTQMNENELSYRNDLKKAP